MSNVPSNRQSPSAMRPSDSRQISSMDRLVLVAMATLSLLVVTANCHSLNDGSSSLRSKNDTSSVSLFARLKRASKNYHYSEEEDEAHGTQAIHLWSWRWAEVSVYIVVSTFLLVAALVKLLYHHSRVHNYVPESCVLIVMGTLFQLTLTLVGFGDTGIIPQFDSKIFFFLLLPPIILESAYSLHDRIFFNNLGTILLYAIVGTLINVFLVAPALYVLSVFGTFGQVQMPFVEILTFSTLICAVDPVAVLAIFQQLGVNKYLYFLVFGESLLNDAVVITMYNSVTIFAASEIIRAEDIVFGLLNFVTVSGGGLIIGIILGSLTALVTRFTNTVRVVEPLIVVVTAYMSYVVAELFHFSGIISLIGCGLMQFEYSKHNISSRSFTTIKYFTKNLSSISDVIIFFYLGHVLVRDNHVWNTAFVATVTIACVAFRFLSVFGLTYIANNILNRVRRINLEEQMVMAYGGLRGAIAFSLAITLDEKHIKNKNLFVTTTLFVILFTVFVLGSTTKPLVRLLRVKSEEKKTPKMFVFIHEKALETLMAGAEAIAGQRHQHYWFQRLHRFNDACLKPLLVRGGCAGSEYSHHYEMVRDDRPNSQYTRVRRKYSVSVCTDDIPMDKEEEAQIGSHEHINVQVREKKKAVERQTSVTFSEDKVVSHVAKEATLPATAESPVSGEELDHEWIELVRRHKTRADPTANRGHRHLRRFHSHVPSSHHNSRRTLSSALNRTSYYQIPGSIHSVDDDPLEGICSIRSPDEYRRRANSVRD